MVHTRSRNPEVILPDFSARVTPPRISITTSSIHSLNSSVSSFHSVEPALSMSDDNNSSHSVVPGSFPLNPPLRPSPPVVSLNPEVNMRSNFRSSRHPAPSPVSHPPTPPVPFDPLPGPSEKGKTRETVDPPSPKFASPAKPDLDGLSGAELLRRVMGPKGFDGLNKDVLKLLLINALAVPPKTNAVSSSSISSHLHWQKAGEKLKPSLLIDGSNFHLWSASLKELIATVTQQEDYFDHNSFSEDSDTALGVLTIIKNSIDPALHLSLDGMTAHGAWTSLVSRFAAASWSAITTRWTDIACSLDDASDSVAATFESFKRGLIDLEARLGGWSTDKLLALTFHSALRSHGPEVTNAMDA
ncbi:hypothetical protein PTTG_27407 [Puccinia triticina 1-1 BBBD Race 1]|uniref:Uncharacterized protein n=1 Tax=Puccinia triticina (isolate 1-1 / race 1 (BBBD)) TaxID=630390 RepID=A0A180GLA3_PUCT1|nr:hypothetical protein PTTG_27407 [Puccinia triticina 1-1 BBBD Race 1]